MVKLVLEGPFAGKTINLKGHQFVDGELELEGNLAGNAGVIKYMRQCYQARVDGDSVDPISLMTTTRLVLHGPLAKQTLLLKGHQFVDGVLELPGSPESNAGIVTYFSRCYQAKLEAKVTDGKRASEKDRKEQVPGKVQPDGGGAPKKTPAVPVRHAEAEADDGSGLPAEGDRHEDSGDVENAPDADASDEVSSEVAELRGILADLDPDDDKHWTKKGLPSWAVVKLRIGIEIPYDDVKKAWPGFNRDYARKLHK